MKWLDIPPIWLIGHLALARTLQGGIPDLPGLGWAITFAGFAIMFAAIFSFAKHRTTPIPHMEASTLLTTGVFSLSRNPIYFGDVVVLLGLSLAWGSLVGVALVPVLVWILTIRFIQPEEARLHRTFGADFEYYCTQTRRWM